MSNKQPHIFLESSRSYENVITCGAPERAEWFASLVGAKKVAGNREYHSYLAEVRGTPILIMSHGVGSAGASIGFQEVINAGAKNIIRLGTAGGLQDWAAIGDAVIATSAVSQDGVSRLMVPAGFPAVSDFEFTLKFKSQALKELPKVRDGIVVTSDVFYPGIIDSGLEIFSKAGCVAVEMELSALFVISTLRGVRATGGLVLDGNPLKWKDGNYNPHADVMKKTMEKLFIAACESF